MRLEEERGFGEISVADFLLEKGVLDFLNPEEKLIIRRLNRKYRIHSGDDGYPKLENDIIYPVIADILERDGAITIGSFTERISPKIFSRVITAKNILCGGRSVEDLIQNSVGTCFDIITTTALACMLYPRHFTNVCDLKIVPFRKYDTDYSFALLYSNRWNDYEERGVFWNGYDFPLNHSSGEELGLSPDRMYATNCLFDSYTKRLRAKYGQIE